MSLKLLQNTFILLILSSLPLQLTIAQCILVQDIKSGPTGSSISFLGSAGNYIFLNAWSEGESFNLTPFEYSPETGFNHLSSEGSNLVTATDFIEYNNAIYFIGLDQNYNYQLYKYTADKKLLLLGNSSGPLVTYKNKLIFHYNGTLFSYESSTNKIATIHSMGFGSYFNPIVSNDTLYFIGPGNNIYQYGGSKRPEKITDGMYVRELGIYKNNLYFVGDDFECGTQLFKLKNGSQFEKITCIKDSTTSLSPRNLTEYNGDLYFGGVTDTTGIELWKYSESDQTTSMVKSFSPEDKYSNVSWLKVYNGKLFFSAVEKLWSFDGETFEKIQLEPGLDAVQPSYLSPTSHGLYFSAFHPEYGIELWQYAGLVTSTSDADLVPKEILSVYPNPSNGIFSINAYEEITSVTLIDVQGNMQMFKSAEAIRSKSSGLFTIRVETKNKILYSKVLILDVN